MHAATQQPSHIFDQCEAFAQAMAANANYHASYDDFPSVPMSVDADKFDGRKLPAKVRAFAERRNRQIARTAAGKAPNTRAGPREDPEQDAMVRTSDHPLHCLL